MTSAPRHLAPLTVKGARLRYAAGESVNSLAADLKLSQRSVYLLLAGRTHPRAGGPLFTFGKPNSSLTPNLARQIRIAAAAGQQAKVIARRVGVTPEAVRSVLHGRTWADAGGPQVRWNAATKRWVAIPDQESA